MCIVLCMEGDLSLASFDQSPKAVKSYTAAKHFYRGSHFLCWTFEVHFFFKKKRANYAIVNAY